MSCKILFCLSILYVVQASIIITVYDDQGNEEVSLNNDCNPQGCDQLCRRLGFTGGACVGDKCECDSNRHKIGKSPSDRYKYEIDQSLEECSSVVCSQVCRKLGFPGGACTGDKCDCDKLKPRDKAITPFDKFWKSIRQSKNFEENQIESERRVATCNDATCNTQCVLIGYIRGSCYAGYCQCWMASWLEG